MSDEKSREDENDSSSPHAAAMDEPQEEFISPEAVPSRPEREDEPHEVPPPAASL